MAPEHLGKKIRDLFFEETATKRVWKCKCGTTPKLAGTGFINLLSHVEAKHSNKFFSILSELNEQSGASSNVSRKTTQVGVYSSQVIQIHGYIEFIVHTLQHSSVLENRAITKDLQCQPLARKTLTMYMSLLTKKVELKVKALLPEKFSFIFD